MPYDMILQEGLVKPYNTGDSYDFSFGDETADKSIHDLVSIYGHELTDFVPHEYRNSFKECGYDGYIPWVVVIPPKLYRSLLSSFMEEIRVISDRIDSSPYSRFFSETNRVFSLLKSCRIDAELCKNILSDAENHTLESFLKSSNNEIIPPPVYSRSSTKTGRLVVKSGPQILTLKKEYRSVLRPVNPDNKLYEIDFISLEPRVALNIAGIETSGDVYTAFAEKLKLAISRDASKLAILCTLYGAGKYKLESLLQKEGSDISAQKLVASVRDYFKIQSLERSLNDQVASGTIANLFDRPIEVDDKRSTVLVNNFLQSTAVDVAIAGFLDFCDMFKDAVRPIFIIHDALIFEAHPEELARINEYVKNGYEMQGVGNFPLKVTELNPNE
jgi:hypothetical protein